jgi:hypothetical protein
MITPALSLARAVFVCLASASLVTGSYAADSSNPSSFERFITDSKTPVDWLNWGADLRVRDEHFEDTFMLLSPQVPDIYNQIRIRTRLWTTVKPVDFLEVNARLTWELRYFIRPEEPVPAYTPAMMLDAWEWDEGILDTLNVRLTNLFGAPLSLTAGRQDIILGNGWLVLDGTPLDGSRTIFLDAARVVYEAKEIKTTFQGIYIDQGAESDRWLKPINAQVHRHYLTDQDERGAIAYVSNRTLTGTLLEGYFIYKHDDRVRAAGADGEIYTPGARAVVDFAEHWNARAEVAPQFGRKNGQDLNSFGFNSLITYHFKDALKNQARLGYEYLSGDDPDTLDNERFDPLWGRWPQWSELLVYNFTTGPRAVEWGNYHRLQAGWSLQPHAKVQLHANYHCLFAPEDELGPLDQGGSLRGQLAMAMVEWSPAKRIKAHLRGEVFWPGDYYDGTDLNRDNTQLFLRGEVMLTW